MHTSEHERPKLGDSNDQSSALASSEWSGEAVLHLLLVEDNPPDALVLQEILSEAKGVRFDITHVERLEAARQALFDKSFDIIMTDLGLPDARGIEAYRSLRSAAPDRPIVVLTGTDDEELGAHLLREGAQDYVVKGSLDAPALSRAVRYAIDRKCAQDQMQHAQRMEALGRLAGGLAHDFNNLLTIIEGSASLLVSEASSKRSRRCSEQILSAAQRGASLTRQLLSFSRKRVLAHAPLELNELTQEVADLVGRVIGETIELELALAEQAVGVRGDVASLEQVLVNLMLNGRDAMPQGGRLTIKTGELHLDPDQAASLGGHARSGHFGWLSVSDCGQGIPHAVLGRIWDPFFSTKKLEQGTGLGLSTAQGIVQQHGGFTHVDTQRGVGSTFTVYLPWHDPPGEREQAPSSSATQTVVKGATILLVEDDAAVRGVVTLLLSQAGHTVIAATNGPEALELFERGDRTFDLVLSDMVMPGGMTGLQLLSAIRQRNGDIPIILSSGYSEDLETLRPEDEEALVFLAKPYGNQALQLAVRSALGGDLP